MLILSGLFFDRFAAAAVEFRASAAGEPCRYLDEGGLARPPLAGGAAMMALVLIIGVALSLRISGETYLEVGGWA